MARMSIAKVVIAEIEAAGLEPELVQRGNHPQARFKCGGRCWKYTFPGSASDHRSLLNSRAGIRRLLREALGKTDLPSRHA